MAENPLSNKYVFGIKGLDMMFERLYKKHGSTMNKMFKGRDLSLDDAMGVLSFIDRNPDMSYVELKNELIPPKKQEMAYGGTAKPKRKAMAHGGKACRGRKANYKD